MNDKVAAMTTDEHGEKPLIFADDKTKIPDQPDDETHKNTNSSAKKKKEEEDKKDAEANDEDKDDGEKKQKPIVKPLTVDEFIVYYGEVIEGIAYDNLDKDRPVVPLKILFTELKIQLRKDLDSGELEDLAHLDPEGNPGAMHKYLYALIHRLEAFVYTKNRIDLYFKEGIGLNIAIDIEDTAKFEDFSDYAKPNKRHDGYSHTSATKSAEQYLKD